MSRRKQANPKPAKRDCDELAASVQLPTDSLHIKEVEDNCSSYAVVAKKELEVGKHIGSYSIKPPAENPEEVADHAGPLIQVIPEKGFHPVHVMLENEGEWIQLMRTAKSANEANVCLLLSGGKVVCRVIKPISEGVELTVTCCVDDQKVPPDDIISDSEHERNRIIYTSTSPATDMLDSSDSALPETNLSECETKSQTEDNLSDVDGNLEDCDISQRRNTDIKTSLPSSLSQNYRNKIIPTGTTRMENINAYPKRISCRPRNGFPQDFDSNIRLNENAMELHKCPHCTYFFRSEKHLLQHMKAHNASQTAESNEHSVSGSRSFCADCNIQFMSPNTYKVHKEMYCKARHEKNQNENTLKGNSHIFSATEPLVMSDDVFLVRKDSFKVVPPVIQPCAFFAAISTNPLVLLPCSLVNSQGLPQQNSLISTGAPITVPAGITGSAVIGRDSISLYPDHIETRVRNKTSTSSVVIPQSPPIVHDDEEKTHDSDDSVALNLKKNDSQSQNETLSLDAPLDLTLRKRKSFCLDSREELFSKARRKNSFPLTSLRTSKYFSAAKSLSPEPNHSLITSRAAITPPSVSNDAINSTILLPRLSPQTKKDHRITMCTSPESPIQAQSIENDFSSQGIIPSTLIPTTMQKQGNNRCEDCNIVFYKYDNYLAHKRHYCAYRRRKLAEMMDRASVSSDVSNADDNNNEQGQQTITGHEEEKNVPYSVDTSASTTGSHSSSYACDDCGVKFSTADNLNAHQTYYCTRSSDVSRRGIKTMCGIRNSGVQELLYYKDGEPFSEYNEELALPGEWKCNYCDAVCSSLKAANRHLLVHSEVRGFCCIICGYRGNTLRGMRTHIYEHLNKESPHIEDLLASSVVPDIGIPINNSSRVTEYSDEESANFHKRLILRDEGSRDGDESAASQIEMKHRIFENGRERELRSVSEDRCSSPRRLRKTSSSPGSEASHKSSFKTILPNPNFESNKHDEISTDSSPVEVKVEEIEQDDCGADHSQDKEICHYNSKSHSETEESDVDVKVPIKKEKPTLHGMEMSVICQASNSKRNRQEEHDTGADMTMKEETLTKKAQEMNGELNYCKSCDITFHHFSNYIAHKKFYCISRVVRHFQQETAPVQ